MPKKGDFIIECRDIRKSYITGDSETEILKGISFSVKAGEFVAIVGPSGSGKSTLMNIIGALDSPTSGKYFFEGADVSELSDDDLALIRRQRIGFVFQSFNLLSRATVLRNVSLPLIYSETPAQDRNNIAKEALRAVDLPEDRWHHLSNQLSGGQMQRVAIARSLVNNPAIILADEPTGNLDSKTGEIVMKIFTQLNRQEKRTIILITHDKEVASHADRIIKILDGEIVEDKRN